MMSITHRATGLALFAGVLLISWWIIFNAYGCASCINPLLKTVTVRFFLVLWTLALYYHLLNGIRHLFWDMGKGFELPTLRKSGIVVLLGAFLLTAASWLAVMNVF